MRKLTYGQPPESYSSTRQPTVSLGDWSGLGSTQDGVEPHYRCGLSETNKLPDIMPWASVPLRVPLRSLMGQCQVAAPLNTNPRTETMKSSILPLEGPVRAPP